MIYTTQNTETGMIIDRFATREQAEAAIVSYETEDRAEGTYTEGFYEVEELDTR